MRLDDLADYTAFVIWAGRDYVPARRERLIQGTDTGTEQEFWRDASAVWNAAPGFRLPDDLERKRLRGEAALLMAYAKLEI